MAFTVLSCTSSQPWQDTVRSFTASGRWKGRLSARFDSDLAKTKSKECLAKFVFWNLKSSSAPFPPSLVLLCLFKASERGESVQCWLLITLACRVMLRCAPGLLLCDAEPFFFSFFFFFEGFRTWFFLEHAVGEFLWKPNTRLSEQTECAPYPNVMENKK